MSRRIEIAALATIGAEPPMTDVTLAYYLGVEKAAARRMLIRFSEQGIVEKQRSSPRAAYKLTKEGMERLLNLVGKKY